MKKILIVDDEDIIRALVHTTLEADGIQVFEASNGSDAWELIQTNPPDLVLLDIAMPGMDGFDLCAKTKADPNLRGIPIVMLTACNSEEDRRRGEEAGADDYFVKPFSPLQLLERVEGLL